MSCTFRFRTFYYSIILISALSASQTLAPPKQDPKKKEDCSLAAAAASAGENGAEDPAMAEARARMNKIARDFRENREYAAQKLAEDVATAIQAADQSQAVHLPSRTGGGGYLNFPPSSIGMLQISVSGAPVRRALHRPEPLTAPCAAVAAAASGPQPEQQVCECLDKCWQDYFVEHVWEEIFNELVQLDVPDAGDSKIPLAIEGMTRIASELDAVLRAETLKIPDFSQVVGRWLKACHLIFDFVGRLRANRHQSLLALEPLFNVLIPVNCVPRWKFIESLDVPFSWRANPYVLARLEELEVHILILRTTFYHLC